MPFLESAWRSAPNLVWTRFDDGPDWVVYHPGSGDVHLLTESARLLWELVSDERPHDVGELARSLADAIRCTNDSQLADTIRDTLSYMDRAGLITPVHS